MGESRKEMYVTTSKDIYELCLKSNLAKSCVWENSSNKDHTQDFDFFTSVILMSALACTTYLQWFQFNFELGNKATADSYYNFFNFIRASHFRLFIPFLCNFLTPYANSRYLNCEICGVIDTFLTIFEIEALTHVCIERYVVAKYTYNGWKMNPYHYPMFLYLCAFFALLYTAPPVIGIGEYAKDFNCITCTFNMLLPENWKRYVILAIWILRSLKPAIFMIFMLKWARAIEVKFTDAQKKEYSSFTRVVENVVTANLFCWTPLAFIRGIVIFNQLFTDDLVVIPSSVFQAVSVLYTISPIITLFLIAKIDTVLSAYETMVEPPHPLVTEQEEDIKED